jgi:hypothetical protein
MMLLLLLQSLEAAVAAANTAATAAATTTATAATTSTAAAADGDALRLRAQSEERQREARAAVSAAAAAEIVAQRHLHERLQVVRSHNSCSLAVATFAFILVDACRIRLPSYILLSLNLQHTGRYIHMLRMLSARLLVQCAVVA